MSSAERSPAPRHRRGARFSVTHPKALGMIAAVAVLVSACSSPSNDPTEYDTQVATNWFQGCWAAVDEDFAKLDVEEQLERAAQAAEDPSAAGVPQACTCQYEHLREEMSFEDFAELDRRLEEDPRAALPSAAASAVEECSSGAR